MQIIPISLSILTAVTAAAVPDGTLSLLNSLQSSVAPYEQYIKGNISALEPRPSAQQISSANAANLQNLQEIATTSKSALLVLQQSTPSSAQTTEQIKEALANFANGVQSAVQEASSTGSFDPIEAVAEIIGGIVFGLLEHVDPEL